MIKLCNLFLIFLLSTCTSLSQEDGLLWEISGNGLEKPSYLLGTFHGAYDILYNFTDSIPCFRQVFDNIEQYVGESNDYHKVKEMDMEELISLFPANSLFLPPDTTYKDLLCPHELQFLDSILLQFIGIPSHAMPLSPPLLNLFIQDAKQENHLQKQSLSTEQIEEIKKQIMDIRLLTLATERGYEVYGLEDHIETVKKLLSFKDLIQSARELIIDLQTDDTSIKELISAYRSQSLKDILTVEEKIKELSLKQTSEKKFMEFKEELLDKRNQEWMGKIPALIHKKTTLIGVGVRHLPGEMGLINLLRKTGYTVRPVQ